MTRLPARPAHRPAPAAAPARRLALASALAVAAAAAPLAAQQTFSLPPASPSPTPAPAGPADERAGVAIPPRAVPRVQPTAAPSPQVQPLAIPSATPQAAPAPREGAPPARASAPSATGALPAAASLPGGDAAAGPQAPPTQQAPVPSAPAASGAAPPLPGPPAPAEEAASAPSLSAASLPAWWPYAAGGLGALVLLGGAGLLLSRRKPRPLRLAAPGTGTGTPPAGPPPVDTAPPRLDLALEVTGATRSVMMFTLEYRLTIANRSERAVGDLHTALQLACARAGAAPSPGAAQALAVIDRIGPQQARSVTGTVQLPLSAIAPLRQGQTPLFIPLAHVTLEAESLPAQARTFVVGTPSASGRVHPIALDVPPGGIAGLVAQAVALPPPPASAAA
jgi:hypothetical protein